MLVLNGHEEERCSEQPDEVVMISTVPAMVNMAMLTSQILTSWSIQAYGVK